ncbi:MAG: methylated-DNA--[protein]-cysteine S-methyltransferase [Roseburia sp.]|nr:methylated-DNA--[protein]-cysteine S-methyltransferase [Roseburia sp.]
MIYTCTYKSPIGDILIASDEIGLTGLWFEGQKYFANTLPDEYVTNLNISDQHMPSSHMSDKTASYENEILTDTRRWLDIYFSGQNPDFTPPLHPTGSAFRQEVWQILLEIPDGKTMTYGEIAQRLEATHGHAKMSAQAVGGAVGHNEISIIIPCHRVVGTSGSLTGYAGGIDKKIALLELEHTDMSHFFVPKKGTAL